MENPESKDRLIIIFYRNSVKGKVKTRLAARLGSDTALEIHSRLSALTKNVAAPAAADKVVFYDHQVLQNDLWEDNIFLKCQQSGEELGSRMFESFHWAFRQGYKKVVIIGTDCPGITPKLLESALQHLDQYPVVIGPAVDGGYYLLGLRQMLPELFTGIAWGTDQVFEHTVRKLKMLGHLYHSLEVLRDIDRPEDLDYLRKSFPELMDGL